MSKEELAAKKAAAKRLEDERARIEKAKKQAKILAGTLPKKSGRGIFGFLG